MFANQRIKLFYLRFNKCNDLSALRIALQIETTDDINNKMCFECALNLLTLNDGSISDQRIVSIE